MFEINIALRHIRSRHRQTIFSVMAVALAVAIITITMSMLSGFTSYIMDSTVENQPHVTVSPEGDEDYIYLYHGLLNYMRGAGGRYCGLSSLSGRFRASVQTQRGRGGTIRHKSRS